MSQTLEADPALVRGLLLAQSDEKVVIGLRDCEYQLHLRVTRPVQCAANGRVAGVIHAVAKRVDVVRHGGRFIEPVYGRPRRLQGTVIAADAQRNTLTVRSRCPFVCALSGSQKATDFEIGSLVGFDIESGATFEPATAG